MLIGAGADVTMRASDGRSAVDVAKKKLDWWRQFAPAKNLAYQEDLRVMLALLEAGGRGGAAERGAEADEARWSFRGRAARAFFIKPRFAA